MREYLSIELDNKAFDEFVRGHENSEFTQLTGWAEVKSDFWYSKKIAMSKNRELIAAALLLFRKMPGLPYTLCYSPRGFVMDYHNEADVLAMAEIVKGAAAKEKAFTIKIDPNIARAEYPELLSVMKKAGFVHAGFTKGIVDAQPRFTFLVDLTRSEDEILKSFNSQTRNLVRKALKNGVFCEEAGMEGLNVFWQLMEETGKRDGIMVRYKGYYEALLKAFQDNGEARMYLTGFRPADGVKSAENELEIVNKEEEKFKRKMENTTDPKKKANFRSELDILEGRRAKTLERIKEMRSLVESGKEKIYLSGGIMACCGEKAYYLYGASSDQFRELVPNYVMVLEMMKAAKAFGIKEYDLGGISGYTEEADLEKDDAAGLYMFKRQFGGSFYERVGEFNCTVKPVVNRAFNLAMKIRGKLR